jgi:hypothetical protein
MSHPPDQTKDAPGRPLWLVKLRSELLIAVKKYGNNSIFRSLRNRPDPEQALIQNEGTQNESTTETRMQA